MKTKKLIASSLLIAIGVIFSSVISIPVFVAKCFPVQHIINVLSAVLLGPVYAVINAFIISIIRNMMGTGSVLAFPGSMIGALLAGLAYTKFKNLKSAFLGEVIGTGILGAIVSFFIAKFLLGSKVLASYLIASFMASTVVGALIAVLLLKTSAFDKIRENL